MAQHSGVVKSLRIGPQGRVVIPVEIPRALAVGPGDVLVAWVEGDRLVLRPRAAVEEDLWARFLRCKPTSWDRVVVRYLR